MSGRKDPDQYWWRVTHQWWYGYCIEIGNGYTCFDRGWLSFGSQRRAVVKAQRICDRKQRQHDRRQQTIEGVSNRDQ